MTYEMWENLKRLPAYKKALELSNYIWDIVQAWDSLSKFTIGKQYINSTDSVSANIAEGYGRFHYKDKIKFYYNARGSVLESHDWTAKAIKRKLLTKEQLAEIEKLLKSIPKDINILINRTRSQM